MKKKFFIVFQLCILSLTLVNAQLVVESTGKVVLGEKRAGGNNDSENVASMMIFGNIGDYRAGSKLTFGDFGTKGYNSWNVFIGEYSNTDTDKLWLHGKYGMYLTCYNSDQIIGYYDTQLSSKFNFNCDIRANGIVLTSDKRAKENISRLQQSLSMLKKLDGVSYNMKNPASKSAKQVNTLQNPEEISEKEKQDISFFENLQEKEAAQKKLKMGFIAQDLQKIFPDVVEEDKDGMLSIDYIGLIPVIVESIKEQQQIIDIQAKKIEEMELLLTDQGDKSISTNLTHTTQDHQGNKLYQNTPNPFSEQTEIHYSLLADVQQAFICIFDMQGLMLHKINALGNNSIIIQGTQLKAGMYLYSLVVDGQEIDTKRMILTK